jgi:NAD(P)-dependent dehydrogenase (short-subunit alcohol dehydrogenase family)
MQDLTGKVAVITGGNSGIGQATAQAFHAAGAKVVIFGRNQETLDATATNLGHNVLAIQGNVTSLADLDGLYAATREQFGRIDILFVNAGIAKMGPIDVVSEADFDQVMDVNLKGAYFTIQKALPLFQQGGAIILNTSINASIGMPTTSVYAASKAALSSLVRTLSADLLERGIRVNSVSPGPVATPIYARLGLSEAEMQGFAQSVQQQVPLKRFGSPEEVAQVVLMLASSDSSYILGTEIVVDGGMSQL